MRADAKKSKENPAGQQKAKPDATPKAMQVKFINSDSAEVQNELAKQE